MSRVYFHQSIMGKSNQKIGQTQRVRCYFRKSYSTSRKGIGGRKKKKILTYFVNLKKKQQDQGGKNWYYKTGISNLRTKLLK